MKGMQITRNLTNFNKYQFLNREIQIEIGLIDLMSRQYDPQRGQFISIDPLSELSRRFSPFTYGMNNPLRFIDPDGMKAQTVQDFNGNSHNVGDNDLTGVYQNDDKDKGNKIQTEEQKLSEIITIKGQKYHNNTSNIFAKIGNKINNILGGDSNYFVEKKPYDAVEDEDIHAFFDNGVAVIAGGVVGKAIGRLAGVVTTDAIVQTELQYAQQQIWKKFGQHYEEFGLSHSTDGMQQYLKIAQEVYNNPVIRHTFPQSGMYAGETWIINSGKLLRLDPRGNFRSLYKLKP